MKSIVLSIGTTHPWNVAGVGRDIVVGTERDARVFTAVAAVSAQGRNGVAALQAVSGPVFLAQLDALPWESAGAVRVGALPNAQSVRAVASALRERLNAPAVVDPVFAASGGGQLADDAAREALRDELATLPNVVLTPNLVEAALLLGVPEIARENLGEAAAALRSRGALAVLLKGGHLAGEPADALATREGLEILAEPRIAASMRGTGCTLAMALACELAAGTALPHAVRAARAYVREQLARH